jgi:PAS domain-containing protein
VNRRDFSPVWLVLLAGTAVTLLAALVVLGPWKDRAPAFLHFPVVLHLLTGLAFVLALASLLFLAWRMGHAARSEVALVELLEQVSEGLMLVDGRGRIVSVNQELQRIFGLGLSELDGQPVQNLLPGWSPEKHHNRGAVNGESRPVLGEFVGKCGAGRCCSRGRGR